MGEGGRIRLVPLVIGFVESFQVMADIIVSSIARKHAVDAIDVWCMNCERAYQRHQHVLGNDRRECPYGCGASVEVSQWEWADLRRNHADYPEVPQPCVVYALLPG
jgi:hypothetical protein